MLQSLKLKCDLTCARSHLFIYSFVCLALPGANAQFIHLHLFHLQRKSFLLLKLGPMKVTFLQILVIRLKVVSLHRN